jgi:hypothetical protein
MEAMDESYYLKKFRERVLKQSDDVRKCLDIVSGLPNDVPNRQDLHNISIMYNNKISEILHHYYECDMKFFDKHILASSIFDYLSDIYTYGIICMKAYMEVRGIKDVVARYNDPKTIGLLTKYRASSNTIWDFDLKRDVMVALTNYIDKAKVSPLFIITFFNKKEEIKEEVKGDLERLGLEKYIKPAMNLLDKKLDHLGVEVEITHKPNKSQ